MKASAVLGFEVTNDLSAPRVVPALLVATTLKW